MQVGALLLMYNQSSSNAACASLRQFMLLLADFVAGLQVTAATV